jgi:hypothetical protein
MRKQHSKAEEEEEAKEEAEEGGAKQTNNNGISIMVNVRVVSEHEQANFFENIFRISGSDFLVAIVCTPNTVVTYFFLRRCVT